MKDEIGFYPQPYFILHPSAFNTADHVVIPFSGLGTTEVIRKRFHMDEKLARQSYDAVVNAFSCDGRIPLDGVDILLQIEKDAKQIPATVTPQMVVAPTLVHEALKELGP